MSAEPRQADLILARLQDSPGDWVSMPELARVSGSMNIHSRIDQLRHQGGHNIQNFMQRRKDSRRKDSFYRLILPISPDRRSREADNPKVSEKCQGSAL